MDIRVLREKALKTQQKKAIGNDEHIYNFDIT